MVIHICCVELIHGVRFCGLWFIILMAANMLNTFPGTTMTAYIVYTAVLAVLVIVFQLTCWRLPIVVYAFIVVLVIAIIGEITFCILLLKMGASYLPIWLEVALLVIEIVSYFYCIVVAYTYVKQLEQPNREATRRY